MTTSGHARIQNGTVPPAPPTGYVKVYVDEADRHVKQVDALGNIIDLTKGEGLIPANTVILNSAADLPTIVGGVYPLAANTNYVVGADFTISNPLDAGAGGVSWTSNNQFGPTVTYTGIPAMFRGIDVSFNIKEARIDCPNADAFDFADLAVPGTNVVLVTDVEIVRCQAFGVFNDLISLTVTMSNARDCTDGILLSGNSWLIQSIVKVALLSTSASMRGIDFGTAVSFNIETANFILSAPAGAVGITTLAAGGNLAAGSAGSVRDCNFIGGATALAGGTSNDIRWEYRGNGGIPDTDFVGSASLTNNLTATVIAVVNTPVKVAGVWVPNTQQKHTADTTGTITYIEERARTERIDAALTIDPVSGTNKDVTAYIAINGSVVPESAKSIKVDSGSPQNISLLWDRLMSITDTVEVWVENNTDTTDLIVNSNILRVSE